MSEEDRKRLSEVETRLFWFRRRLLVTAMFFSALACATIAYLDFGAGSLSQDFTYMEQVLFGGAVLSGIGVILYATPWKVPLVQWTYWMLAWVAAFLTLVFFFAEGFQTETRWVIGSMLLAITAGAYTAHIVDGGRKDKSQSLLYEGPV